jgi:hypothetical protein
MRRWTIYLAVTAAALCACGAEAATEANRSAPADLLFVPVEGGLDVLSATSGHPTRTLPGGIASPDYSVLASTEPEGDGTLVRMTDLAGEELVRASVAGQMTARVVSPSGALVAVTEPAEDGSTPYVPAGRSSTKVTVVDADGKSETFDLRGNFEPEAFSTDDRQLFLIEYIPARAPTRYRVRRLLLSKGKVFPIGRLKTAAPGQMQGTGRTQVYSPYGNELYTLYTQQKEAGHDHDAIRGEHAFVHLLNLDDGWTHCIDLPASFGSGRATASAVAVTPQGDDLFVVDWTKGIVADAQPAELRVVRSASVDFGAPDDRTYAQVTGDRLYVGGGSDIVVLDTDTLRVVDRWPMRGEITGLTLTDDAERLYVATAGAIDVVDVTTGETGHEIETPDALGVVHAAPSG